MERMCGDDRCGGWGGGGGVVFFFFFNDTATTEIYTLSLHDALPIWIMNSKISIYQGFLGLRIHFYKFFLGYLFIMCIALPF